MIKTIEIVSLSSGTIGESFVSHELKIGLERLKNMGLQVKLSGHTLKGIEYMIHCHAVNLGSFRVTAHPNLPFHSIFSFFL